MTTTLVVAEFDNVAQKAATLNTKYAAQMPKGNLHLLADTNAKGVAGVCSIMVAPTVRQKTERTMLTQPYQSSITAFGSSHCAKKMLIIEDHQMLCESPTSTNDIVEAICRVAAEKDAKMVLARLDRLIEPDSKL